MSQHTPLYSASPRISNTPLRVAATPILHLCHLHCELRRPCCYLLHDDQKASMWHLPSQSGKQINIIVLTLRPPTQILVEPQLKRPIMLSSLRRVFNEVFSSGVSLWMALYSPTLATAFDAQSWQFSGAAEAKMFNSRLENPACDCCDTWLRGRQSFSGL